jgi:predicted ATPase
MSANGIGALERGYRRTPQRETLALLATALALNEPQRQAFEAAATRRLKSRQRLGSVTIGPWPEPASILPLALTSFVGRQTEVDEIASLVRAHRLVTLTGAGGIGKTQTALQTAAEFSRAPNAAVAFVGLAIVDDGSFVAAAIAGALGVQPVPRHPLIETLIAYLNNKTLLLILDNCEQVVSDVALIAETLLLKCPQIRILATGREALMIGGERTYRLPPLSASDAIALFADRAQAIDPHFTLSDRTASTVSEICDRLGGIPLAIELAAARVDVLSLNALAANLDDGLRILIGGERTALSRQQTMGATIDWSYNLLSTEERRVFERLSVFVGGCTLDAAMEVCATEGVTEAGLLDLLASLIKKSLVLTDLETGEPRYWMLEPFRRYAYAKLIERGEQDVVARLHALACLRMAEWFNRAFDCEAAAKVRDRASHEQANWRSALQWSLAERHDVVLGQELAGKLGPYFSFFLATARNAFFFGHLEGRRWIAEALDLVDERTPGGAFAALKYAQARIAGNLREYEAELECSEVVLSYYRAMGDSLGIVRAQTTLSHALLYLGRRAEATAMLEEALMLARQVGERGRFTYACLLRLSAVATQNDVVAARAYIEEAIRHHKALAHESSIAMALLDLSECELGAGNPELALKHAMESLAAAPVGNAFARSTAMYGVSVCLVHLARYDEATKWVREALDIAREFHFGAYIAWCVEHLATIATLRRNDGRERQASLYVRSARIAGYADARLKAIGSARLPFVQPYYRRSLDRLRDAIGAPTVTSLMADGATMTEDEAIEAAISL